MTADLLRRAAVRAQELADALAAYDWRADGADSGSLPCRHQDHKFHAWCAICCGDVEQIAAAVVDITDAACITQPPADSSQPTTHSGDTP